MKLRYILIALAIVTAALTSCVTTETTAPDGTVTKTTKFDTGASESLTKSAVELAPVVKGTK